jgi:hypothetical protein
LSNLHQSNSLFVLLLLFCWEIFSCP